MLYYQLLCGITLSFLFKGLGQDTLPSSKSKFCYFTKQVFSLANSYKEWDDPFHGFGFDNWVLHNLHKNNWKKEKAHIWKNTFSLKLKAMQISLGFFSSIPAFCLNKQSIISQCEEAYKGSSKHLSLGPNSSHSSSNASLVWRMNFNLKYWSPCPHCTNNMAKLKIHAWQLAHNFHMHFSQFVLKCIYIVIRYFCLVIFPHSFTLCIITYYFSITQVDVIPNL